MSKLVNEQVLQESHYRNRAPMTLLPLLPIVYLQGLEELARA